MLNKLVNYQESGVARTTTEANAKIQAAKEATPAEYRNWFFSKVIRIDHEYEWYWILK